MTTTSSESATPRRGLRFLHARQIDGSPKAGTATPVAMIVSKVTALAVYYGRADAYEASGRLRGTWYVDRDRFDSIVLEVLPHPESPRTRPDRTCCSEIV